MREPDAQTKAWLVFDDWHHKLIARFPDQDFGIPLENLVEWFGLNEPMDVTVGRCINYWIAEVAAWGGETDPNKWDMERTR